jgi:aminoglycoside/choline kinase family phosphotransferase
MNASDILSSLFEQWAHTPVHTIVALPRAGSNRAYYRLSGGEKTAIGTFGNNTKENKAFLTLAACLRKNKVAAPEIYGVAADGLHYLQEDVGDVALFDLLHTPDAPALLQQAVTQLAYMQVKGAEGFDWSNAYPTAEFDARTVFADLNYFKYHFLKLTQTEFDEWQLEDDFNRLAQYLLQSRNAPFLMYRDFQSRNIMVQTNGDLRFIDFQGARRGPLAYDLASFLFQSRAGFSEDQRETLLRHYLRAVAQLTPIAADELTAQFYAFGFFRTLQTLGAYGYRGLFEKKALFLQSIPAALHNLRTLIHSGKIDHLHTNYLFQLINNLNVGEHFQDTKPDTLTVTIHSFSFRNGYPNDFTGNGGGFVFDCRGLKNPGRLPEFKNLTGRDKEVAAYIETQPAVKNFLQQVYGLLDNSVSDYKERHFTDLSVAFGCTGGQHRSVYCAEQTAAHLARKHGVNIRLIHREQHIEQFIPAP